MVPQSFIPEPFASEPLLDRVGFSASVAGSSVLRSGALREHGLALYMMKVDAQIFNNEGRIGMGHIGPK